MKNKTTVLMSNLALVLPLIPFSHTLEYISQISTMNRHYAIIMIFQLFGSIKNAITVSTKSGPVWGLEFFRVWGLEFFQAVFHRTKNFFFLISMNFAKSTHIFCIFSVIVRVAQRTCDIIKLIVN